MIWRHIEKMQNAVSALLKIYHLFHLKILLGIKEELKTLVDQSGISINEFFTCNTDIINALLSNGHYKRNFKI